MITATQAKSVSDDVNNGDPVDTNLINESNGTGNLLVDEMNHSVVWAAKQGEYTAYLAISKFSDNVIATAITTISGLGYVVSTTRLHGYKELVVSWD